MIFFRASAAFSLGLERTGGFETVAFCEIEDYPRRVLAKHWPKVPCYNDVRELTGARLAADGIAVDVICGGFPCQDISCAGQRAGISGERSGLWSEIARLVGEIRPRFIIVENVARLLSDGMGTVLGDLAALRYNAEWECISAAAVGAPHQRERIWIVAYPEEGMRNRDGVFSKSYVEGDQERFKRIWTVLRSRRARMRPPANFGRLHKADGLSARMGGVAALGNAVVPQIPQLIGQAILQAEGLTP